MLNFGLGVALQKKNFVKSSQQICNLLYEFSGKIYKAKRDWDNYASNKKTWCKIRKINDENTQGTELIEVLLVKTNTGTTLKLTAITV